MAHADTLERDQSLAGFFWGSLTFHISLAGALVAYALIGSHLPQWGDKNGGAMGSVAVSPVATIPLPSRAARPNPVANPTESQVPAPPPKAKPQPKPRTPPPDAIPLKSKVAPKPERRVEASAPNKFREKEVDLDNQLYSTHDRAVSSPMFQMQGAGGVGIGNDSPLGQQFGGYAKLIIDQVGRNWKTSDLNPRLTTAPAAIISFTIRRDGSLAPGSVKVDQSSGILPVDLSAQRAVMDAAPFPALPQGFTRSEAQIQLRFELRR